MESTDGCDILPKNMATRTAMDRLLCDLDCEELHNTAQSIKDHGSRSYDVLVAHDASNDQNSDALCATSTCRRIDFHELELFLETELSASVEVTEIARPTLEDINPHTIVRVDKLAAGQETLIAYDQDKDNKMKFILHMQTRYGEDRLWEIVWRQ